MRSSVRAEFSCLTRVSAFADVDFVTPLCSQVVYEGLVDDIFRIKCGEYNQQAVECLASTG